MSSVPPDKRNIGSGKTAISEPAKRKTVRERFRELWALGCGGVARVFRKQPRRGPNQTPRRFFTAARLRGYIRDIIAASVGAAAGAIGGQVVLPTLAPNLERWAFDWLGISVGDPRYLTVASKGEVDALDTANWELNRLFCGLSSSPVRYCLVQAVVTTSGKKLDQWPLNPKRTIKAVLLGLRGDHIDLSWMSQQYATGGWAYLALPVQDNFVGYGIACVSENPAAKTGDPYPIKVLLGRPTTALVEDVAEFRRGLLRQMAQSKMMLSVEDKRGKNVDEKIKREDKKEAGCALVKPPPG